MSAPLVQKYSNNTIRKVEQREKNLFNFIRKHGEHHKYVPFLRSQLDKLKEKVIVYSGYVHIKN